MSNIKYLIIILCVLNCSISLGQEFAISVLRENTLYIGIPNTIEIAVCQLSYKDICVKIDSGTVVQNEDGFYTVNVKNKGIREISLYKINHHDTVFIGKRKFRAKFLPSPTAKVAGKNNGFINKNELIAQTGIIAGLENFDICTSYSVLSFSIIIVRNENVIFFKNQNNGKFDENIKNGLRLSEFNDRIILTSILVKTPDGNDVFTNTIELIIK